MKMFKEFLIQESKVYGKDFEHTPEYEYLAKDLNVPREWLPYCGLVDGRIHVSNAVGSSATIHLPRGTTKIKFPFYSVAGSFFADDTEIDSLENLPEECFRLGLVGCKNLKSLKGIHNIVKTVGLPKPGFYPLALDETPIERAILGLLKINNLRLVTYDDSHPDLRRALDIIKPYMHKGGSNEIILQAQNLLIDADLDDYAEL